MVPILLIVLRQEARICVFARTVFGIVQLFLGGYGFTLVQVTLDYPLAYTRLGPTGFFEKSLIVGVAASLTTRFLAHFVSGVISAVVIYLLIQRGILEYNV